MQINISSLKIVGTRPTLRYNEAISWTFDFGESVTFDSSKTYVLAVDTDYTFTSTEMCIYCAAPTVGTHTLTFTPATNTTKLLAATNGARAPLKAYIQIYEAGTNDTYFVDDCINLMPIVFSGDDAAPIVVNPPIASATKLGCIKVGNGLAITVDGTLYLTGEASVYWADILNKPTAFPPSAHTHAIGDVTSLTETLSVKADLVNGKIPSSQLPPMDYAPSSHLADTGAHSALFGAKQDALTAGENVIINGSTISASAPVQDVKLNGTSCVSNKIASIEMPVVLMPACTGMGIALGVTTVQLTWKDPDNVVFNSATLATWQRTVAVAKQGSFPTSVNDGVVVAATSRNPSTDTFPLPTGVAYANKNAYELSSVTVQVEDGNTVCIKLFSATTSGQWNAIVENEYPTYTSYSWAQLAEYADAGTFLQHIPIGSALDMEHTDFAGHQWLVIDEDLFKRENQAGGHTVALLSRYILFDDACDAAESQWALTADTAAVHGVNYAIYVAGVNTPITEGTDWEPGATSVTRGGVVYPISEWLEKNPNPNYSSGSNLTPQRNDIQWMNSYGPAYGWFTKQNLWDNASSALQARAGFRKGLPAAFDSFVVPCERTCYNYPSFRVRGRGNSSTYISSIFPLTVYELFAQPVDNISEGLRKSAYFDTNAKRQAYKLGAASASVYWCASAFTNFAYSVSCVHTNGASASSSAGSAFGYRPACAFGKQVNQ